MPERATVNVRYMVDDVDASVEWYTKHLGFALLSNHAPAFADVTLGALRLLLSGPTSSAGRPMPDGARPGPRGWNRIHLIVDDLAAECARLRDAGVTFRNDVVTDRVERKSFCSTLPAILLSCFSRRGGPEAVHKSSRALARMASCAETPTDRAGRTLPASGTGQ